MQYLEYYKEIVEKNHMKNEEYQEIIMQKNIIIIKTQQRKSTHDIKNTMKKL